MNSEEGSLLKSKINEDSAGRHFLNISCEVFTLIIPNQLICESENSSNGGGEFEIIHVQVNAESYFVVISIGFHPELPVVIVIRIVLVAGEVYRSGKTSYYKWFEVVDPVRGKFKE